MNVTKNIMVLITTIVGPVAISNTKESINPNIPLNNEISTE